MSKKPSLIILLYILIVIIPSIAGSYYFIHERYSQQLYERTEETKRMAAIHESYWDNFVSETVTSLQMLSMTTRTVFEDFKKIQPLLERAHKTDPRYSGIYLLDKEGLIVTGSTNDLRSDHFMGADYIKEVIDTKDTIISNQSFLLENGKSVIGLSVPILSEEHEISAILVALLRMDYIENVMNILTPSSKLLLLNAQDKILMSFNIEKDENLATGEWYSMPIERLPWKIKAKIDEPEMKGVFLENLFTIASFLILTHILFLFILFKILQHKALQEKKKIEAQKLELVGTLAASTAHEIRNPLTGIKGLIQLLSEKHKEPTDQFYFSVINEEIERINEIASEFLILGKPTATVLETEDLTEVIHDIYPLISTEANLKNINFQYELPTTPVFIKCTKSEMKQVILNITRNSFEALADGGNLSICLKVKGQQCELLIIDNGDGIGEEIMEKIFIPFYTSKEKGTGLGLIVCQRIIQSFHGQIEITSIENKGTTVKIILPLAVVA